MHGARSKLPASDAELLALAVGGAPAPKGEGAGLFGAESWLRRVSGEGAVLFGGGCALLLEVAHPLVAAGVAEHSRYRDEPFERLSKTLAAVNAMAFGRVEDALAAARGVEAAHARVRGTLSMDVGHFPAGTPYDGRDPELVRWVWATLAWTARAVYRRVVGPLAPEAERAYFAEHAVLARLLGVPPADVPETPESFDAWFEGVVGSGDLAVGPQARDIAAFVLEPPAHVRALVGGRMAALTALLLPEPVREDFGIELSAERRARTEAWLDQIRAMRAPRDLDASGPTR
ncbi:MAG: oxygenase MpaB family protein [Myxococcota bacterium]|nr:oxygenase MpaB family protein [Myxococcota bacterium]